MVVFPNCKINLGLRIINKRSDGYHELETLMYPVPYYDILEVMDADQFQFTQTGSTVAGSMEDNICVKAYRLMVEKHAIPPVSIHLHKQLPMGAGMGGGSADATFTLKVINDLLALNLSVEQLQEYSAELGSDCPFFVKDVPQLATGRGEILEDISLDLKGYFLVLIHPAIHISTAEAFRGVHISGKSGESKEISTLPVENWKGVMKNDFENHIFENHPELAAVKSQLYESGAIYASMTGSGSVVYGLFKDRPNGFTTVIEL